MITTTNAFRQRVKEVDTYFSFLNEIISNDAKLYFPNKSSKKIKDIDSDLTKILRANGFLLLYNLIESTIKNCIEEIYTSLNQENATYKSVSPEIKKKWIETQYKNFKPDEYVADRIYQTIENIENDIISMAFNSKKNISGNIDSRKVEEFSVMFGFSSNVHYTTKKGEKLFIVKNKRNDLAHGLISFSDCGKDYTIEQLIEIKRQVITYLKGILKNITVYIDDKKFLVA